MLKTKESLFLNMLFNPTLLTKIWSFKENKIMKIVRLILILFISFLISCDSNKTPDQENLCIEHFLEEFNMKSYEGEDLACKTFIRLHEFESILFAVKGNRCVDFAPFTIYDCDGEEFCFTSIGPCYIQESIDHGIIGIEH